jgi:hypothetical protein
MAGPASTQPFHKDIFVSGDVRNPVDMTTKIMKHILQGFCLRGGARKPIQDRTIFTVRATEAFLDHGDRYIVRDELTLGHILLGKLSQFCFILKVLTENITGGYVHQSAPFG